MTTTLNQEISVPLAPGQTPISTEIATFIQDIRSGHSGLVSTILTLTLRPATINGEVGPVKTTIPVGWPVAPQSQPTPGPSPSPPPGPIIPSAKSITPDPTTIPNATGIPPQSTSNARGGVSGGAVAGVAIGCLIAGAVIAFIACFFLYRRRNQKYSAPYQQPHLPYDTEHKSGAAVRTAPLPSAAIVAGSSLPQPVEDAEISKEVSRIRDNIKNHVQNFYHYQPVHRGVGGAELAALAAATNLDPSALEALLVNSSTRGGTIRLFIAWAMLSRCEGQKQPTLLPSELAPIVDAISRQGGKNNAQSAWFRQWRVLTGALLEQEDGARFQASNLDIQNWSNIADSMDHVLGLFVPAGSDEDKRRRNLEMVLNRASKLAVLLFSQPGLFHFDFTGSRPECPVVFPSLLQVAGDEGQVLNPSKVLWEKEMATD